MRCACSWAMKPSAGRSSSSSSASRQQPSRAESIVQGENASAAACFQQDRWSPAAVVNACFDPQLPRNSLPMGWSEFGGVQTTLLEPVLAKADVQLLPGHAEHLRGARLVVVGVLQ